MSDATRYRFNVHYQAVVHGEPRPVALSARTAKIIHDALVADGFVVVENALAYGVGVEVSDMVYSEDINDDNEFEFSPDEKRAFERLKPKRMPDRIVEIEVEHDYDEEVEDEMHRVLAQHPDWNWDRDRSRIYIEAGKRVTARRQAES